LTRLIHEWDEFMGYGMDQLPKKVASLVKKLAKLPDGKVIQMFGEKKGKKK